ncbi:hypothetical protein T07_8584 [Trichinella nelsoni]|uniref:Uncharacterized protein n=1 Tax=Trichinella nelsoni TaxID=6336 RepID=A0A0V0S528_9BILA|nr:hypothetical protein T07_8584 [Trichinella nelsoni]
MQFARCYAEYAELLVFARLLFFVIKFVWNVIILLGNDKHLLEERDVVLVISGMEINTPLLIDQSFFYRIVKGTR